MNVDKFGHHVHKRLRSSLEIPPKALVESEFGVFDLQSKRIKGAKLPVSADEVVNKEYVDKCISQSYNSQEFKNILDILRREIIASFKSYLDKPEKQNSK